MTAAAATAARAARMRVANWEKEGREYFVEQRTSQFNTQTFMLVCCGVGEKLFAEGFGCWTCPFYTLSGREYFTEKIFRSPVHAAQSEGI